MALQTATTRALLQTLIGIELAFGGDRVTAKQRLVDYVDACNNEVHALRRRTHPLAGSQPPLAGIKGSGSGVLRGFRGPLQFL